MAMANDFNLVVALFGLQGFAFAFVESSVISGLIEFWEDQSGRWIQLVHGLYGIGSIFAPFLIGYVGYKITYLIFFVTSMIPLLLFISYYAMKLLYPATIHIIPVTIPLTPISSVSTDSNQSIDEISSRSIG